MNWSLFIIGLLLAYSTFTTLALIAVWQEERDMRTVAKAVVRRAHEELKRKGPLWTEQDKTDLLKAYEDKP